MFTKRAKSKRSSRMVRRALSALTFRRAAVEPLEDRLLLSIRVWDGGTSGSGLWSDASNWVGDVAPVAGDDLVFPVSANDAANTNDLAAGTRFNTVQIQGSGYNIAGNAIELYGGLTANNASGSNTFALDVKLVNAQSFFSANEGATLNLAGTIDTANLVGTSNYLGTSALTLDGAGAMNITGQITGAGSLSKYGSGTATLSGSNDYQGITDVRQGVLIAANNTALGSATTGDTQIQAGAALGVQGGVSIAEPLAVREGGVGFGSGASTEGLGALRNISGTNTWSGNIDLTGGNNLIGADGGSTLIVSGVISDALSETQRMIKVGGGTLRFTGSQPNVYRGETRVLQGTLELGKDPGVNAFWGNLIIGNDFGGNDTAVVRLLADDQIPSIDYFGINLTSVTVNSSGWLDFNGHSDTIGNLTLVEGQTYSADITTGAGTLILGGASLTLTGAQGSSPASPPATISGKLDLGSFFSGSGGGLTKTFNIGNSALASVDADLVINADISGTADVSLTRSGAGALTLAGNNTYAGPTILTATGVTRIASDSAFGTGLLSIQNNGVVLRATYAPRTVTNLVSLDSNFAVRGTYDLTFTGPATLTGDRTITVLDAAQTTTFAGGIGEGIFGSRALTKAGRGTLALTGANTYSGATTVALDGGKLVLKDGGTLLNTSAITVNEDGILRLDNSGAINLSNRLNDLTTIALTGGELAFVSGASGVSSETVGWVTLTANTSSTIRSTVVGAGIANLSAQGLTVGSGATIQFYGVGAECRGPGTRWPGVPHGRRLGNGHDRQHDHGRGHVDHQGRRRHVGPHRRQPVCRPHGRQRRDPQHPAEHGAGRSGQQRGGQRRHGPPRGCPADRRDQLRAGAGGTGTPDAPGHGPGERGGDPQPGRGGQLLGRKRGAQRRERGRSLLLPLHQCHRPQRFLRGRGQRQVEPQRRDLQQRRAVQGGRRNS